MQPNLFRPEDFEKEIHQIISKKYDRLLWNIAHKISGCRATASLEDNYADLWLAVFEAIEGFTKQNNYANGQPEEWIESKAFDKYLKTCLWNKKNHKGKPIMLRYPIHRDTVPTDIEEVLNVCCPTSFPETSEGCVRDIFNDIEIVLSAEEKTILECVLADPDRYLTDKGKVKISPLQRKLGWDRKFVGVQIQSIKKKMSLESERVYNTVGDLI